MSVKLAFGRGFTQVTDERYLLSCNGNVGFERRAAGAVVYVPAANDQIVIIRLLSVTAR